MRRTNGQAFMFFGAVLAVVSVLWILFAGSRGSYAFVPTARWILLIGTVLVITGAYIVNKKQP